MTDRIHSITVVLGKDIRIDDAEQIISAIGMIKGVIKVTPNVSDIGDHVAYERARQDLASKILDVLRDKSKG